jgi:hypothetical protein
MFFLLYPWLKFGAKIWWGLNYVLRAKLETYLSEKKHCAIDEKKNVENYNFSAFWVFKSISSLAKKKLIELVVIYPM